MEIRMYQNIVVLTGAGISAASGLQTFRGKGGLWEGQRVENIATPQAFLQDPEFVQKFYNMRRRQLIEEAQPNAAHHFLARFEQKFTARGGTFLLVTQNVDDLHERAGSERLVHMHGELLKARNSRTGEVKTCRQDLAGMEWRPHIVWFGETPLEMDRIYKALAKSDLFVAIGTSGHVYPAAGFVEFAGETGSHTVEINLEASKVSSQFDEVVSGPAITAVEEYFSTLF
ncbi:MAG: NAD-dependent protein deacylase [Deltaproteobacteria bacterium]|nr:MAG: NAD-dependent protein deacylase [Deltaproteobacteria bacterium]PIE73443.1 MAG: NAD-dependent protein deacylase [Deltaproteobacteria bacterium]